MATSPVAVELEPGTRTSRPSRRGAAAPGGVRFDWLMATWVSKTPGGMILLYQSVGLAGFLLQPVVLMGPVLYVLRRQPLPVGSLTLLLSVNVALMAIIHDKFLDTGPVPLIGAAVLTGVLGDALLWGLRPSPDRPLAFRAVAFTVPAVQYLLYFVAVLWWARLAWSVHLWTGAIVIAGGVGWLLGYLVLPPAPARVSRQ